MTTKEYQEKLVDIDYAMTEVIDDMSKAISDYTNGKWEILEAGGEIGGLSRHIREYKNLSDKIVCKLYGVLNDIEYHIQKKRDLYLHL